MKKGTEEEVAVILAGAVATLEGLEKAMARHEQLDQERFKELAKHLSDHRSTVFQAFITMIGIAATFAIAYFTMKG